MEQITGATRGHQVATTLIKTVTSQRTTSLSPMTNSVSIQQQKTGAAGRKMLVETFQNLDLNSVAFLTFYAIFDTFTGQSVTVPVGMVHKAVTVATPLLTTMSGVSVSQAPRPQMVAAGAGTLRSDATITQTNQQTAQTKVSNSCTAM